MITQLRKEAVMATFNLIVGIPGSGKTTFVYNQAGEDDVVLDSDEIREELLGSAEDQSNHDLVFRTMEERAIEALKSGRNVWYVATNLVKKYRVGTVRRIQDEVPGIWRTAWYITVPLSVALERNANRDRRVPEDVIHLMYHKWHSDMMSGPDGCWTMTHVVDQHGNVLT